MSATKSPTPDRRTMWSLPLASLESTQLWGAVLGLGIMFTAYCLRLNYFLNYKEDHRAALETYLKTTGPCTRIWMISVMHGGLSSGLPLGQSCAHTMGSELPADGSPAFLLGRPVPLRTQAGARSRGRNDRVREIGRGLRGFDRSAHRRAGSDLIPEQRDLKRTHLLL